MIISSFHFKRFCFFITFAYDIFNLVRTQEHITDASLVEIIYFKLNYSLHNYVKLINHVSQTRKVGQTIMKLVIFSQGRKINPIKIL